MAAVPPTPSPMAAHLLQADAVQVTLGSRRVLDGVSLTLQPGQLLGIIGPNGAGKSMLLRTLLGMQPVAAGTVQLFGQPLSAWPARNRARHMAYLAQNPQVHWPLPVRDVVALGRLPHGDAHTAAGRQAVEKAMAHTDCTAFAQRNVQTLSGGECARVLLARALATQAPILLADEPLAALDPAHQLRLMGLLQQLAKQGMAVAVVLHDLTLAARYCDEVLVMHQGRVAAAGKPQAVLTDDVLQTVFDLQVRRLDGSLLPWQAVSGAG